MAWLRGALGGHGGDDSLCGKVVDGGKGGVYSFDGRLYHSLVHRNGYWQINSVPRLSHEPPRLASTLSEAALVEYAQVHKALGEVPVYPKVGWVLSLFGALAQLQKLIKMLDRDKECGHQDEWYAAERGGQDKIIVRRWSMAGNEKQLWMRVATNSFDLVYRDNSGKYAIHKERGFPGDRADGLEPTSLNEVLSDLKTSNQDTNIQDRRIAAPFQERFLSESNAIVAHLIGSARSAEEANRCDLERLRHSKAQLEVQLSALEEECTKKDDECKSLQKEVAGFRISAGRAASGDSKNVADGSASRFPSMTDALQDWRQKAKSFSDFYDDLELESNAKVGFAEATFHALKCMHIAVDNMYKNRLKGMLRALGDLETISSLTRSTEDAFNVYCRRHWEDLFVDSLTKGAVSEPGMQQENMGTLENRNVKDNAGDMHPVMHPATCGAHTAGQNHPAEGSQTAKQQPSDSNLLKGSERLQREPDNVDVQAPISGSVTEFSKRAGGEFVEKVDISKLKEHLKGMWRSTVALYLQRPVLRLNFESPVVVRYSRELHDLVYETPQKGAQVLLVVPCLVKAPDGFSVFAERENEGEWTLTGKGLVDKI